MGEHVCAPTQKKTQDSIPMEATSRQPKAAPKQIKTGSGWERKPHGVDDSPASGIPPKTTKAAPPRINPAVASE